MQVKESKEEIDLYNSYRLDSYYQGCDHEYYQESKGLGYMILIFHLWFQQNQHL